jgi:hypothetical protein
MAAAAADDAFDDNIFSKDIAGHSVVHHWNRLSTYRLSSLSSRGTSEPWPTCTDVCCWHCTEPFRCQPVGIPHEIRSDGTILCDGNFCSYSCALTYIFSSRSSHKEYRTKQLLAQVAREVHNITEILPAPPALALSKFGGPMTIEMFRTTKHEHAVVVNPPFVCQGIVFEEREGNAAGEREEETDSAAAEVDSAAWAIEGLRVPERPLEPEEALSDSQPFGPALYDDFLQAVVAAGDDGGTPPTGRVTRSVSAAAGNADVGGQLQRFIRKK